MKLETGTRIFNHGDMANISGFGTITKTYINKWGSFVDIKMDDGEKIEALNKTNFSETYLNTGMTRFVTLEVYSKWKEEKMFIKRR